MLLMNTVAARRYPSLEAPCITSRLSLKNFGKLVLQMRTAPMKTAPMKMDVETATTTANFVSLGLFAPSSFDTLTLSTIKCSMFHAFHALTISMKTLHSVFLYTYPTAVLKPSATIIVMNS